MYDLIIIGGGPAGITAGIYATRQKLNTLLITKSFGGQVAKKAVAIENYPGFAEISGLELIRRFKKHLRKQKIDIERDEVTKIKKIGKKFFVQTKSKHQFQAKAVIVASGADPRPLEVEGEKKYIGRGLSYCPTCDGPLFEGKTVAIIGGGNAGFEAAIFLSLIAKKIYILEYGKKVGADEINQERVKKTGKVEVITNVAIKKIQGDQFVNSLVYEDRKTGREKTLAVEGVFIEIGSQPATSFIKGLVDFNEKDEIIVNPKTGETRIPGLFAAGDIDDVPYKQIVIAAGEGTKAALSAYNYLQKF
ncbi:MAG: thioredoxin-disulfide reductase [Candidatus Nealsonbacteria bacterium CG18_big_fil_WC_8_21_14_2_50_37_10]|uniref:Thioredoxin-disulfide reductase n=1 Tax=Candidatus Nealsonbacteria bacterium CG18_big_fil_WC_8_21_14_2_50_37_10 TaxID=1974717 RepID=A0A2H0FK59_9BACT|nr:MAG: thioredoxin-disulfide reductase [Candidatus Nealsonbacteria bacterium CG18_big_fil_WC_8_21_14_2_50_37_10]